MRIEFEHGDNGAEHEKTPFFLALADARFWHLADLDAATENVRIRGQSGHPAPRLIACRSLGLTQSPPIANAFRKSPNCVRIPGSNSIPKRLDIKARTEVVS